MPSDQLIARLRRDSLKTLFAPLLGALTTIENLVWTKQSGAQSAEEAIDLLGADAGQTLAIAEAIAKLLSDLFPSWKPRDLPRLAYTVNADGSVTFNAATAETAQPSPQAAIAAAAKADQARPSPGPSVAAAAAIAAGGADPQKAAT